MQSISSYAGIGRHQGESMTKNFIERYRGNFTGILRWSDFDALWTLLAGQAAASWFVYRVGETPPVTSAAPEAWQQFLADTARLLKDRHKEDYCGVVYVDVRNDPGMVKIFDPDNLGMVCGFSDQPPLPGWVLSKSPPQDLVLAMRPEPRPWWRRLWRRW